MHKLNNSSGMKVCFVDHGASIQSIEIPVSNGYLDVLLGYDSYKSYLSDPYYLGATLGRFAGRIRGGIFPFNQGKIKLSTGMDGKHCLHGGLNGLSSRIWSLDKNSDNNSITFRTISEEGDQGFPGELDVCVCYSLKGNALIINLSAISSSDTILNLSNHAYFNLSGKGSITDHEVLINADFYTPIDNELIPTGEIFPVKDTKFDFRKFSSISSRLEGSFKGFDHNFVLNKKLEKFLEVDGLIAEYAASAFCLNTGISLNVYTTQPGLQFYTGQGLSDPFVPLGGFCFEAQGFPNSPNEVSFPSSNLRAGDLYNEIIIYQFDFED